MIVVDHACVADALSDISCSVQPGEIVGLIGHNGSGKSTLGRLICGAQLPDSGSVSVDGAGTADVQERAQVRRLVGYVGQNPADQTVSTIVRDEVAFGLHNTGCTEDELPERISQALDTVDLAGCEDREVTSLSGGELQRLVIASVLAMKPTYVVLDEITAQLDGALRTAMRTLIMQLADAGVGVVLVTHDPLEVLCCNRVLILDDGRVTWEGSATSLLVDECDRWRQVLPPDVYIDALRAAKTAGYTGAVSCDPADLAVWARQTGHVDELMRALGAWISGDDANGEPVPSARADERFATNRDARTPSGTNTLADATKAHTCTQSQAQLSDSQNTAHDADLNNFTSSGARGHVLHIDHVSVAYGNEQGMEALHELSLSVSAGSITLVAGPSGAGKTTLACTVAGLLEPMKGTVLLDGVAPKPGDVGLAFQNPESQLFLETVERELAFAPMNQGSTAEETEQCVAHAAAQLHIESLLEDDPFQLSAGQARRVALASVLTLNPRAVVFDEPTAGLDAPTRTALHALVHELAAEGLPVLVVSHDLEEWLAEADTVALLQAGRLAWHGTPGALAADPAVFERAGLAAPASWQLAALLKDGNAVVGEMATDVHGASSEPDTPERFQTTAHVGASAQGSTSAASTQRGDRTTAISAEYVTSQRSAQRTSAKLSSASPSKRAPLDTRVKMLLLLAATIAIFAAGSPWALALWVVIVLSVCMASGMRARATLRSMRPVLVLFVVIICFNLVSCDGSADIVLAGSAGISLTGVERAIKAIVRIALLLFLALSVASTTTPTALADACTSLMCPLRHLGVPVADIGLVLSMALRFIPVVSEEAARIRLAQRARGVIFDEGSVLRRVRAWATVLTPLVVGLFRRADRVAESMDARCYGQADAMERPVPALAPRDCIALVAGLAGMVALTAASYLG